MFIFSGDRKKIQHCRHVLDFETPKKNSALRDSRAAKYPAQRGPALEKYIAAKGLKNSA